MQTLSYLKSRVKIEITKRFGWQLYGLEKRKLTKLLKNSDKLVLIYTIGKVGSSSVYDSLKASAKVNIPVFHIHALNPERIEEQKQYYKDSKRGSVPFHLIQSTVLSELLPGYTGQIHLITLVREPIQRELSSLFQDSFNFTKSSNLMDSEMKTVVEDKVQKMLQKLPEDEWFVNELKHVFGFDIYKMPFDPDSGYWITHDKDQKIALAFIRLENLRSCFSEAMTQLFELEGGLPLVDSNVSDAKFYNEAYKQIKRSISLSGDELNKLLETHFIQKFYADKLDAIRERWIKKD